jgi:hypothetical protein
MTKGDFIFETSRAFGLDDTAGSDELILMQKWLGRGVTDVLIKTHCYVDMGQMTLQAGVTDYRTDSEVLAMLNVTTPDSLQTPTELDVIPMDEILPYLSQTIATTDVPTKVAIEGTLMRIAPAPASAVVLTYIFVPRPTSMGEDGTKGNDTLDPSVATYGGIPTEYNDAILAYMSWQAAMYDDKQAALSPVEYRQQYEGLCKDAKKQGRRKAGRGLHRGRVGYPGSIGYPSRNDVYPSPRR